MKTEKNNLSIKSKISKKIIDLVSDSTAHGIKNAFKSNNWIVKIFWMILFLISSSVASYCNFFESTQFFYFPSKKFRLRVSVKYY